MVGGEGGSVGGVLVESLGNGSRDESRDRPAVWVHRLPRGAYGGCIQPVKAVRALVPIEDDSIVPLRMC